MTHDHSPNNIDLWFRNSEYFQPHAHCVLYDPVVMNMDRFGNILVGISYLLIPLFLSRLVLGMWRTMAKPFRPLIIHGATFVLLCGMTHFLHAWNWTHTNYAEQAILEGITGIVSIWFAIRLLFFIRHRSWET